MTLVDELQMNLPKLESFKRREWAEKIVLAAWILKTCSRRFLYLSEHENRKFKIYLLHLQKWRLHCVGGWLAAIWLCRLGSWRAQEVGFGGLSWGGLACHCPSSQISSKGLFLFGNSSLIPTGVQFELLMECYIWCYPERMMLWGISGAPPRQSWGKTKIMYFIKRVLAAWHSLCCSGLFCAWPCCLRGQGDSASGLL